LAHVFHLIKAIADNGKKSAAENIGLEKKFFRLSMGNFALALFEYKNDNLTDHQMSNIATKKLCTL
jgi:hypothetical protein